MPVRKRFTIEVHRALRLEADKAVPDVVNDADRQTLSEDAADLAAFEKRRREPAVSFDDVVSKMRRSGKL